jgi:hypothetical protein
MLNQKNKIEDYIFMWRCYEGNKLGKIRGIGSEREFFFSFETGSCYKS